MQQSGEERPATIGRKIRTLLALGIVWGLLTSCQGVRQPIGRRTPRRSNVVIGRRKDRGEMMKMMQRMPEETQPAGGRTVGKVGTTPERERLIPGEGRVRLRLRQRGSSTVLTGGGSAAHAQGRWGRICRLRRMVQPWVALIYHLLAIGSVLAAIAGCHGSGGGH